MTLTLPVLIISLLMTGSAVAQTQNCDTSKQESSPASRFIDQGNGAIKDTQTSKLWLRCAVGMKWSGRSCEEKTTTHTYFEALAQVERINKQAYAQRSNWRLPTRDELTSIVEQRCFNPAINLDVFPYSPQSGFWTSTENAGLTSTRIEIVHFLNGDTYIANKNQLWRLRLIAD
jgi:hypothetical protein